MSSDVDAEALNKEQALRAECDALALMIALKPSNLTEAVIGALVAFEGMEKTHAARVGCARAVQKWQSTMTRTGRLLAALGQAEPMEAGIPKAPKD